MFITSLYIVKRRHKDHALTCMLYTDTITFMLGPVPNVLLIVLHVKQVPMLLFVLYNMFKALVGTSH